MTTDLQALSDPSRLLRQRFDDLTGPHREALWRFCRKLTGNPWDAEDLVQDVLLKAFARLSFAWQPVEPRPYLFRIASNAWIDRWRRERATTELDEATHLCGPVESEVDALDTRDALRQVVDHLPPRQRVVFLLTEGFGFAHAEVAAMLRLTLGAVKALRFRARATLAAQPRPAATGAPAARPGDTRVLERYADAFNRRDVDALVALFRSDAVNEIVGVADEIGTDVMRQHSLAEWLAEPLPTRALVRHAGGRPVVVVLQQDAGGGEAVAWVVDVSVGDGRILGQRLFCFCPELLAEVGAALGLPVRSRGHHYAGAPS